MRNFIRNCPSCQVQTTHPAKPAGLLQPLNVPPYAWHTVTTDYITGLPLTPKGNNAISVFVDKLTKYVYAVPCNEKSSAVDWANMYVEHVVQHCGMSMRDFLLSSYLTGVLNSLVLSIGLYLSAWASLGICLPHAILKLMVKLIVQIGSLRTSCVTLFLLT